jgi:D-alanyl-D-alanine carboxypeptidase
MVQIRTFRKVFFLFLFFLIPLDISAKPDRIDSYIHGEMEKRHIRGLSLVVIKDGKIVKAGDYGIANLELNVPVTDNTSFEIASMTKQFTVAAILLLVEERKLSLEDKLTKYFTDLPGSWHEITIRQLMNHTSGLRDDWDEEQAYFLSNNTDEEFVQALKDFPLKFKPGDEFSYSCGPFILGMLIPKVSGETYPRFMQQRIFGPLGMTSTHINDVTAVIPNRAAGNILRDGVMKNGVRISPAAEARGDVGILTTTRDMARWDLVLNTTKLLKQSSLREMFTPAKINGLAIVPYGLGWFITPHRGHLQVSHGGGFRTGFTSTIDRYLDDRLTVIILTNRRSAAAYSMSRAIAGFYNPDYRLASSMMARPDINPTRTEFLRKLLQDISSGTIPRKQIMERFHNAYPGINEIREALSAIKEFSFIDCFNNSKQPLTTFGEKLTEFCFYRIKAAEEGYWSFGFTSDGRVGYIEQEE